MAELTWFERFVDRQPILAEEKKMWLDAGFMVLAGLEPTATAPSPSPSPEIVLPSSRRVNLNHLAAVELRSAVIARWERLCSKSETQEVRVVEVDSVRDSLEARS